MKYGEYRLAREVYDDTGWRYGTEMGDEVVPCGCCKWSEFVDFDAQQVCCKRYGTFKKTTGFCDEGEK